jgi:hypothetical protein
MAFWVPLLALAFVHHALCRHVLHGHIFLCHHRFYRHLNASSFLSHVLYLLLSFFLTFLLLFGCILYCSTIGYQEGVYICLRLACKGWVLFPWGVCVRQPRQHMISKTHLQLFNFFAEAARAVYAVLPDEYSCITNA